MLQLKNQLLDFCLCASFLQLGDQLLCVFLGDSFLQGLGAVVDKVLSVLQAQAGSSADNLDDVQLGSASGLQDDVELGLLFDFFNSSSGSSNSSSSSGNAENLFQGVNQLSQFQNSQFLNLLNQSSDLFRCHDNFPPNNK